MTRGGRDIRAVVKLGPWLNYGRGASVTLGLW